MQRQSVLKFKEWTPWLDILLLKSVESKINGFIIYSKLSQRSKTDQKPANRFYSFDQHWLFSS